MALRGHTNLCRTCVQRPRVLSTIMRLLRLFGIDHQPFFVWLVRSYHRSAGIAPLLRLLQRRPSAALLSVMVWRFEAASSEDNFKVRHLNRPRTSAPSRRLEPQHLSTIRVDSSAQRATIGLTWMRVQAGRRMLQLLGVQPEKQVASLSAKDQHGVWVPGLQAEAHNFWVFPVFVRNSRSLLARLRAAGVDASSGSTQISLVQCVPPSGQSFDLVAASF